MQGWEAIGLMMPSLDIKFHVGTLEGSSPCWLDEVSGLVEEVHVARNCGWQLRGPKGTCSSQPAKHQVLRDTTTEN